MDLAELKEVIESNVLSVATVSEDNKPHCIAVVYAKVVDDKIIITDNYMAETVKNITQRPSISIAVYTRTWEKKCWGYEIRGTAKYFSEGKWRDFVKTIDGNKNEPAKGAIVITVEKIKKLA